MHLPDNKTIIKFKIKKMYLSSPYPNTAIISMFPVLLSSLFPYEMVISV